MLKDIILFEIRYHLRRPLTYVFASIMFFIAILAMTSDIIQLGGSGPLVKINAPSVIATMMLAFSLIGVIILPSITGTAVIRDIETKTHELLFTTPISKFSFVFGRFIGSFGVTLLIYALATFGLFMGAMIAPITGTPADKVLPPWDIMAYIIPYLFIIIPNAFFFAAISFSVGLIFRNFVAVYVQGFALIILWSISTNFTQDIENRVIGSITDPFGFRAFGLDTFFWTPAERNFLHLPIDGYLLLNRIVWIAITCVVVAVMYRLFTMSVESLSLRRGSSKRQLNQADTKADTSTDAMDIPKVSLGYSVSAQWKQFVSFVKLYFLLVIREKAFIAISLIGLINFFMDAWYTNHSTDLTLYPVTFLMLGVIGNFSLYSVIISALYAGELTWKERSLRLNNTFDALPVPSYVTYIGKITALTFTHGVLYLILVAGALVLQTVQGYYDYQIGTYLFFVLVVILPSFLQINLLSFFIHSVVNNKYLGHFVVVLFYILRLYSSKLGMEHDLWDFGFPKFGTYSAFNGYSPFLIRGISFHVFFVSVGLLLACIGYVFWVRGTDDSWKQRLAMLRTRLTKPVIATASLVVLCMSISGGWIYYNINIRNTYRTEQQQQALQVHYEKEYRAKYRWFPQPRITDVFIKLDLYPERSEYVLRGVQTLVNKHTTPIDTLLINWSENFRVISFDYGRAYSYIVNDTSFGFRILKLREPLQPGDSMKVSFAFAHDNKGFKQNGVENSILPNGTFLNSDICPSYGYKEGIELDDEDERKKQGLPKKARMLSLDNPRGTMNSYLCNDADLITFEAIISTAPDQIAIAPGYLQREWEATSERVDMGKRRYYHYKMDSPIWNFYSFLSGRYAVTKDVWKNPDGSGKNVALEIYHLPEHTYNLPRFMEAAKRGLDYYTKNFSPYQHRQYRVIEFPRYAQYAQAFPNTIPFSEAIEFIAQENQDADKIDKGFFVNAHELGHQWWAHQVLGSEQQGSTLLSESLAEYSALRVMEKKYGAEMMQKFLKYELDYYLRGRAFESKAEQAIVENENQPYIHYYKGSLVFYALADYIGEDKLNTALSEFIGRWQYKHAPYPTSRDMVATLRSHTPDSLQYVVTDLFEKITLFENSVTETKATKNGSKWDVTLNIKAKKFHADSVGNQKPIQLGDYIDVGVFAKNEAGGKLLGKPLYFKKHKITKEQNTITVTVNQEPSKAGIDPYSKLIDREPDDNIKSVDIQ
jgi:ABC-2 type transport system permease protein